MWGIPRLVGCGGSDGDGTKGGVSDGGLSIMRRFPRALTKQVCSKSQTRGSIHGLTHLRVIVSAMAGDKLSKRKVYSKDI